MRIIPAVDILGARCVRLFQGDYDQEEPYSDDPVGVAAAWEEQGAEILHLVDLDGARDGRPTNRDLIAAIVARVSCLCEVGGGIREIDHIRWYQEHGITRIVLGSMAITDPEKFEHVCEQSPGAVVLAIDARDGMVATHGWQEVSSLRARDVLLKVGHLPLAAVQYTDISKDGTLKGPNLVAIREMAQRCPFPFVAAGGIGSLDDIRRLRALDREIGERIWGVIVGQALYHGVFSLKEALKAVYADGLHPAG